MIMDNFIKLEYAIPHVMGDEERHLVHSIATREGAADKKATDIVKVLGLEDDGLEMKIFKVLSK